MLVLACHIGAMLNKELCDIEMAVKERQMGQCQPALVLACRVGATLNKELCDIEMAVEGCQMGQY